HDDTAALAANVAVGRGIERLAASVRRGRFELAKIDMPLGRQDQVDAARQGQAALARPQRLTGEMDGEERRRTGGIDREIRPLQTENVGDASSSHTESVARPGIGVDAV